MKDNKLIADFMGVESTDGLVFQDANTKEFHSIKYHTSWDWLMPVVEKINTIDDYKFSVNIYYHYTTITNNLTLIDIIDESTDKDTMSGCYNAVVKFIIEYNKTNDKR